ncbi:DUF308 domain-containing protein [Peribacillus butanolivorans]|uniref:DUF308 domain-containing protein n=1 Tax=Peribacillus butanolivorans TaxID=421767 RepID=UPI002E231A8E|nr:DUF308 domain-containing protein [Peribacillus butanolivorans]
MEKDQYSSIDDEMRSKEESVPAVVDDQHHERYYNEDTAVDDRRYENRESNVKTDNRYREETSAEISTPPQRSRGYNDESVDSEDMTSRGNVVGVISLIISIISLFMMPFILGALGIIVGIFARVRGSKMGTWAIVIGAVSIIVGIFILPFF